MVDLGCSVVNLRSLQWLPFFHSSPRQRQLSCESTFGVRRLLLSAFLTAWEIMALSSFILIIFEYQKRETLNAGINFLIQSHICILFLTLGFIWVSVKMNNYDFTALTAFSKSYSLLASVLLFLCFFFGFAIKAGFVPFHTWLPYAHPVAPAHISGIMSGVIIKIGIYGILRMLLLIKTDYLILGYIILFISILSGLYGVMLAIIQHNL